MKYLKLFNTHSQYEAYASDAANFKTPNVSVCRTQKEVHFTPLFKAIVVTKYNVTDLSYPTKIGYNDYTTGFSEIEIDGVVQPTVESAYTFSETGEHTIKYTLANPTTIVDGAFAHCRSLTSATIPDSVTILGNAFSNTRIKNIIVPDNVTTIDGSCFSSCSDLENITIGSGVTYLGHIVFLWCESLTSITCNAMTAPTIESNTFAKVKTGGTLYVPIGSTGYDTWIQNAEEYLGYYNWTKVEI